MKTYLLVIFSLFLFNTSLFSQKAHDKAMKQADAIEQKVIEWRRYFHENPELSNREFKTAEKIAEHLKSLGLEV